MPTNISVLKLALIFLGVSLLISIIGIIWLSSANPARSIPDVLVAVTTGILGTIGGILVNPRGSEPPA